jgi:hypothetical protein
MEAGHGVQRELRTSRCQASTMLSDAEAVAETILGVATTT